jgi:hypothetical protein
MFGIRDMLLSFLWRHHLYLPFKYSFAASLTAYWASLVYLGIKAANVKPFFSGAKATNSSLTLSFWFSIS